MDDSASKHWENDDLKYLEHHLRCVDFHKAPGENLHRKRRDKRGKERRTACHRHRKRNVSLGEKGNHVRRRPPSHRTNEHTPSRKLAREAERLGEQKADERHDEKLQEHASCHRPGAFHDAHEVTERERGAHSKHYELYRGDDKRRQFDSAPFGECRRKRERNRRASQNRDAECLASQNIQHNLHKSCNPLYAGPPPAT